MIYTPLYFSILNALLSKFCIFLDLKMTYWHSRFFWDAYIFYVHNMSINKTTFWEQVCIIWFFMLMLYVYSNVIQAAAMSKLLVTDFLLVGLPLLYLSRFEPHSDCLCESHVVLADGEVVPYGDLPLLFHLPACHDSREWNRNNLDHLP